MTGYDISLGQPATHGCCWWWRPAPGPGHEPARPTNMADVACASAVHAEKAQASRNSGGAAPAACWPARMSEKAFTKVRPRSATCGGRMHGGMDLASPHRRGLDSQNQVPCTRVKAPQLLHSVPQKRKLLNRIQEYEHGTCLSPHHDLKPQGDQSEIAAPPGAAACAAAPAPGRRTGTGGRQTR